MVITHTPITHKIASQHACVGDGNGARLVLVVALSVVSVVSVVVAVVCSAVVVAVVCSGVLVVAEAVAVEAAVVVVLVV